jgi:hypothetical protein
MSNKNIEMIAADTGPLIHLASVNALHLISDIATKVVIPDLVLMEAIVTGKPYASEIDQWVKSGVSTGKISIASTDSGESVRLARVTEPTFRLKDGGEKSIVEWLLDEVNGTDKKTLIIYENGKVPSMLLRWNSDMNATVVTTHAFLRVCEEASLLNSSDLTWQKMVQKNPTINQADQQTNFRRVKKIGD